MEDEKITDEEEKQIENKMPDTTLNSNNSLQNQREFQNKETPFPFKKSLLYPQKEDSSEDRIQNILNDHRQIFPPTLGVSQPAINEEPNESKQSSEIETKTKGDSNEEEKIEEVTLFNPPSILANILIALGISPKIAHNPFWRKIIVYGVSGCFTILFLVMIITVVISGGKIENGKKEISSYLAYGILDDENTTLIAYLKQGGWCETNTDCLNSSGYRFLSTFRKKVIDIQKQYQKYNDNNNCHTELVLDENDTSLFIATIFYNRSNDELLSAEVNSFQLSQYEKEMDYIIQSLYTIKGKTETEENQQMCYELSKDAYKEAIVKEDGYIDQFRLDLGINLSLQLKIHIYEKIEEEMKQFMQLTTSINGITGEYIECSGVTVVDSQSNVIGTYSLEEYVAGVISGEIYEYFPEESKKALAVAARTYVLSHTNSCKKAIESSSRLQNFNSNIREDGREVAKATQGEILIDKNGNIFASEYDSWNCKGQNTCIYTKKPYGEMHEVTISDKYLSRAAGGHGRGMSQIAAADMADRGMNYREILKFFYSEGVQISNLTANTGVIQGNKYVSSAPLHNNVNDLWGNQFYNPNAKNVGQCVWYARNRAQEILFYSNMAPDLKSRSINSIKNTMGNGEAWFRTPDGSLFAKSTDVTQPRAGAIVSWSGGVNDCTPRCGHVAIIESINSDGTVTISEGWKEGDWSSLSWSTVRYRKFNTTIDYIKYHKDKAGNSYYFNGYVYLLG